MVILKSNCISKENTMFELSAAVFTHLACVTFPSQSTFTANLLLIYCVVSSYQLDTEVLEVQTCWSINN